MNIFKKTGCTAAAVAVLLSAGTANVTDQLASAASYRTSYTLFGDVNNDGVINVFDAVLIRAALSQKTEDNVKTLDLNCDGTFDAKDVQELGQYIMGNGKIFTAYTKDDADGDGLCDMDEIKKYHSDPDSADTDGDGMADGDEVNKYNTDPCKPDPSGSEDKEASDGNDCELLFIIDLSNGAAETWAQMSQKVKDYCKEVFETTDKALVSIYVYYPRNATEMSTVPKRLGHGLTDYAKVETALNSIDGVEAQYSDAAINNGLAIVKTALSDSVIFTDKCSFKRAYLFTNSGYSLTNSNFGYVYTVPNEDKYTLEAASKKNVQLNLVIPDAYMGKSAVGNLQKEFDKYGFNICKVSELQMDSGYRKTK